MKKLSAVLLAMLMMLALAMPGLAVDSKLTFSEDGKFRVLQINDFQDSDNTNAKNLEFMNTVLDTYKPDLVVFAGDQVNGSSVGFEPEVITTAIRNMLAPLEARNIPFLFTFGNHDRDHVNKMSMESQAEVYRSFANCMSENNGPDAGTSNTVIYAADGKTPVLNIYMMDTNHWLGTGVTAGSTSGVTETQVEWYKQTSNELKALNGGEPLPSLVFQHIPVKEIYQFLKEVPQGTAGAVRCSFDNAYYILDENAEFVGDRTVMKEAPCSEHPDKVTGQYQAWVEQGDIIGAYFGHDHINTFVGKTADGIVMGYNGGFGYSTYGEGDVRYARIYDFDINNVTDYKQTTIVYTPAPKEPAEPEIPEIPEEPEEDQGETNVSFLDKIKQFFQKIFDFFKNLFS